MSSEGLSSILAPAAKRSLADEVAVRLREAILQGRFSPGEQLRESVLAELLGVSRGPVREALNQLEREGLVIVRPNRSAIVASLGDRDLEEICSLHVALECLAVHYVCRRAGSAHVNEMQRILDAVANGPGMGHEEAAALDIRFHDCVFQASNHRRLLGCWSNLRAQIQIFLVGRKLDEKDMRDSLVRGHNDILCAIRERNEQQARILVEAHLRTTYDRIREGQGDGRDQSDPPAEI